MKTHKDLNVWKNCLKLVLAIYKTSCHFPKDETFGLISQVRRASVSVVSNISEGAGRYSNKEFIRFLQISMGSLAEVETLLVISCQLNYLDQNKFNEINGSLNEIRAQLTGLIKALRLKEN
jgi:four helix bundle protein